MPAARRVAWAQLRVGLMALVALAIAAALIFLLTGKKKIWTRNDPVYTYMDDAVGLASSSPVRLNGILVGEVKNVSLSGETTPNRVIRIAMEIERDKLNQIPVDSLAAISAENVLGTKFINIKKGQSTQSIQPGAEIRSLD